MKINILIDNLQKDIIDAVEGKGKPRIFPGGFDSVNKMLGGGYTPGIVCVMAQPGAGKSTFCVNEALHVAGGKEGVLDPNCHNKVLYISTEKSADYMATWFILAQSKITATVQELQEGRIPAGTAADVNDALDWVKALPIEIEDKARKTTEILEAIEKEKPKFVFIDSVQDIQPEHKSGDMVQDATKVITELKDIQIKTGTIIIIVSHINAAAQRSGKIDLTSPAFSSRIGYYSDVVLHLSQLEQTEKEAAKGVQFLEIDLLKSKETDTAGGTKTARIVKKSNSRYLSEIRYRETTGGDYEERWKAKRAEEEAREEEERQTQKERNELRKLILESLELEREYYERGCTE